MIKIACVGDNVVDINYIDGMIHPGGNCVNVAVYASQLGHEAAYVGVLADDGYAKIVGDSMVDNGVDISRCVTMHGETGRCTCKLVDGDRILGDENDGGLVKSDPLQITDGLIGFLKNFDIVHTSCYSYLDEQLYRIKEAKIPLLYDFSTVWDDVIVEKIGKVADYILFSSKDEFGEAENLNMMKAAVDRYGCAMAIMTMGTRGAFVYDGKAVYEKLPYNAAGGAIDTTGCGDSWITGFITTYIENMKRIESMTASADKEFLTPQNIEDARACCIKMAMSIGNMKARHTCRVKGAYGCGIPLEEYHDN